MKLPDEWTVFPLLPIRDGERLAARKWKRPCGCGDPNCTNAGKHPAVPWRDIPSGKKVPIPDGQGIGLATGVRSGVVVLDLDYKPKEGINGLEEVAKLGEIPPTLMVQTPSGGFHVYFQWPGYTVQDSAGKIGPGIDIRGDGGYVVIPDSPHDNGGVYQFMNWGTPIAPLPDWLAARLARSPGADGAPFPIPSPPIPGGVITTDDGWKLLDKVIKEILAIPNGQRNDRLFQKVAKLGDAVFARTLNEEDAKYSVLRALSEAGWTDPQKCADTVERAIKGSAKGRIVIIEPNHKKANDRAIELLSFNEQIYVTGNVLSIDTGIGLQAMTHPNLEELLSSTIDYRKADKDGNYLPVHVPTWAAAEIYDRGSWPGLRVVEGFSDVPLLRPDGTVASQAGYDSCTRVILSKTSEEIPMTEKEAAALLRDIVCDVPFQTESHLAAWLCAVLSPLAMYAFDGPIPAFLFEASLSSSGKTNLATVSSLISTGRMAAPQGYTEDDGEMSKKITGFAKSPSPIVFFDNMGMGLEFGGDCMSRWVTSPDRVWQERELGGNRIFKGKINSVIYASSNQTKIGPDMERRVCPIRITPMTARPDLRTGFKHDPWIPVVRRNQEILTWAALKLLRAEKPKGLKGWSSFTEWRDLVVGACVAAGFGTPDAALEQMRGDADHVTEKGQFVRAWRELLDKQGLDGMTSKQAYDLCFPSGQGGMFMKCAEGAETLRTILEEAFKRPTSKTIGYKLRELADVATPEGRLYKRGVNNGYTKFGVKT